jgi:predicted RND superfamily exporter protein
MNAMQRIADRAVRSYNRLVLDRPLIVILCLIVAIGFLGYKARNFKIDASAETLLLENDADLRYTRQINDRYGLNDLLVVAYSPKTGDLLDDNNLAHLKKLQDELAGIKDVASVMSLLDAPLLESPPIKYNEFSGSLPTLQTPGTDKKLARAELHDSPFYRDRIVSQDMKTTALQVNLKIDEVYRDLLQQRNALQVLESQRPLTATETKRLGDIKDKIDRHLDEIRLAQHKNIQAVRAVLDRYRADADLFLGGISMVADDMITFIKSDLEVFGIGVFFLLILMLGIIFRKMRWILLPMLCCFLSVVAMMGILAAFDWEVTVISSNFISLQLIITLSIVVHLIVRYREIQAANPQFDRRALVLNTVRTKFTPCLYATLTTIAGFGSLLLCDIKPVINFGWMMSAGLVVSLLLTFILFPVGIILLRKPESPSETKGSKFSPVPFFAGFTQNHGAVIMMFTAVLSVATVIGVSRLVVENSFIDYFKQSTEIYQGMKLIDQKLGGTTPLDVIIQFDPIDLSGFKDEDEWLEEPDPFADEIQQEDSDKYWFVDSRMQTVEKVHDYLEALPATGKVLSIGTLLKIGRRLKGSSLDSIDMAVFYTKLPDDYKNLILKPYLSIKNNEARFAIRIKDSLKGLKRDALLKQIRRDLVEKIGLAPEKVHLAGTMVLYNNMLQSLFASQIKTMGVVALALMAMFLILFRSLKVSLIALFPNLLSAGAVLGVMGWMDIPLDMMTITIAAISMGIAVDDTIHYIYRFSEEIRKDRDYIAAMHRCHGSIGHAMYYTSITIIIGFSILVFSSFWPTIYFGIFTGLAMFIAMVAALTLLPRLIVLFKPFKVAAHESILDASHSDLAQ